MPPDLPGLYWDADKGRYFATTPSAQTPSSAAYTPSSIKRRNDQVETAKKVRRRKNQIQKSRKRSAIDQWWTFQGTLDREIGDARKTAVGDVRCMSWAQGLMPKGHVKFAEDRGDGVNLDNFCVVENGIIACADDEMAVYVRTRTTQNGGMREETNMTPDNDTFTVLPREVPIEGGAASLECWGKDKVFFTSKQGAKYARVGVLDLGSHGGFLASTEFTLESPSLMQIPMTRGDLYCVNTCAVTPPDHWHSRRMGHGSIGYLGLNRGVARLPKVIESIFPTFAPLPDHYIWDAAQTIPDETFSIAFQPGPGGSLVLGGGRKSKIWSMGETKRYPCGEGRGDSVGNFTHGSPVSNVRFINEFQLLAAGPRSKMALYDIRFKKAQRKYEAGQWGPDYCSRPILTFPTYVNEARFDLGFDVSPDGQSVVAGQEDGTVKVFSTGSGTEMGCPALAGIRREDVVRKIKFDQDGSLYIGLGGSVRKFGFGSGLVDDA